jgi:hypothetical protein
MRQAGHVAHMVKMRYGITFWLESLKGEDHVEDLGVDRSIILKWTLRTQCGGMWIRFICFRIGTSGGLL